MKLTTYMADQTLMLTQQYSREYNVTDIPAVYFAGWATMQDQLQLGNAGRLPAEKLRLLPFGPGSRVLQSDDGSFHQLWVERDNDKYRDAMKEWLLQLGVVDPLTSTCNVDHLRPRSHLKEGTTVVALALVASGVNSSWGGGHERVTKLRANKIRGAATLLQLAKALQIRGTRKSGTTERPLRTWADVAVDLHAKGIIGFGCPYTHPTRCLQLECELRSCANELAGWNCPGRP